MTYVDFESVASGGNWLWVGEHVQNGYDYIKNNVKDSKIVVWGKGSDLIECHPNFKYLWGFSKKSQYRILGEFPELGITVYTKRS